MKTNKWKLSLLVWGAMFPFSTALHYGLAQLPWTAHWPVVARTFCLTCLLVPYMVFGVFPLINRHFLGWLQDDARQPGSKATKRYTVPFGQPSGFGTEPGQVEPQPHVTTNGVSF